MYGINCSISFPFILFLLPSVTGALLEVSNLVGCQPSTHSLSAFLAFPLNLGAQLKFAILQAWQQQQVTHLSISPYEIRNLLFEVSWFGIYDTVPTWICQRAKCVHFLFRPSSHLSLSTPRGRYTTWMRQGHIKESTCDYIWGKQRCNLMLVMVWG